MGIARPTFDETPADGVDDTALVEAMHAIKDAFEAYGWRRMQAALQQRGWVVNDKKLKRLMREHGLHPPRRRRFVVKTDSDHDLPIFPDRRDEIVVDGPNQLWVADLTFVAIGGGFVDVALIMDAWSRRIVGYAKAWDTIFKSALAVASRRQCSAFVRDAAPSNASTAEIRPA